MSDFSYREKKCHKCGKLFIVQNMDDYVYKRNFNGGDKYFCSWGCLRKWEADRGPKALRRDRILEGLKQGLSVAEISSKYGIDKTSVAYWKKKLEEE